VIVSNDEVDKSAKIVAEGTKENNSEIVSVKDTKTIETGIILLIDQVAAVITNI
jgi:hypothetical protein